MSRRIFRKSNPAWLTIITLAGVLPHEEMATDKGVAAVDHHQLAVVTVAQHADVAKGSLKKITTRHPASHLL